MSKNFCIELKTTYNIELSPEQEKAVLQTDGPCLLLAVPGGGKTTTLLSRTAYLINELKVPSSRILSLTFSRASAKDMKARFEDLFKGTIKGKVAFSTIHSFAYGVVMNYKKSIGEQVTLIEGNQQSKWSKGKILRQLYQAHNNDFISEGDYEVLTNDLSYVKNLMMETSRIRHYKSEIQNFYDIYLGYEDLKQSNYLIDFDDMLTNCYEILTRHKSVRDYYQARYDYIQVDEAQDTSRLQHAIIEVMAAGHRNLFYVADDDQSIYGFRGATPSYLLNLKSVYETVTIIKMEQNYRSTSSIVAATNQFIKKNVKRYDKNIYTHNGKGLPILVHEVSSRLNQYPAIIEEISEHNQVEDVAILYRNNHSAVSMIHQLSKTTLPFKLRGLKRGFFDHWVIRDILHMLNFASDTCNVQAFKSFYYKLRGYYISKQMVEGIEGIYQDLSVFEQMIRSHNLPAYQVKNIHNLSDAFESFQNGTVFDNIEMLLTEMGYLEFLVDRTGGTNSTFESYNMMIEILKDLSRTVISVEELEASIRSLERVIKDASENTDPSALTLSTIHSSKGLEWTKVFMIDLISGIFPNSDLVSSGDVAGMEEERRLFYVGMTRAKTDLILYKIQQSMSSPFLDELCKILNPSFRKKEVTSNDKSMSPKVQQIFDYNQKKTTTTESYLPLDIGTVVIHKTYGEGIVKACSADKILLVFKDGEKQLGYQYSMNKGLIYPHILD